MKSSSIGSSKDESLEITVLNYERAPVGEFHDDNWLHCELSIRAGAFRGEFHANVLTSELQDLLQGLTRLHRELSGDFAFESMEQQLMLKAMCDSRGHLKMEGRVMDQAGVGSTLSFIFQLDQTHLSETLRQLSEVARAYPVRA